MAIVIGKNRSSFVAFTAVFAALVAVFDSIQILPALDSGIWYSWVFLTIPLVGIMLGPLVGAFAVGLGSFIGHFIYFRGPTEFLFMLGASVGAAMAALIYQRRWRPALGIYSIMLVSYFLTPVTRILPIFGVWDVLLGFSLLLAFALCTNRGWWPDKERHSKLLLIIFCAVIGLEADILFRIFLLIPCQTYWLLLAMTPEVLLGLWLSAGITTPLAVIIATIVTATVGLSLLQLLPHLGVSRLQEPES